MASDILQILRSSVPLLRPNNRCPGELYVNFADNIIGYIDTTGTPQDVGPFVFANESALAAFSAATSPRANILAFAGAAFYLSVPGETSIPGLPGWRKIAVEGDVDLTEVYQRLGLLEVATATNSARITSEELARVSGDEALARTITTLQATVATNDANAVARSTEEATVRATADSALASQITSVSATVTTNNAALNARVNDEATARAAGDTALAQTITTLEASVVSKDTTTNARITSESQARVDGDNAQASRSASLEASNRRATSSGGNLLDNAFLVEDAQGWQLNGWTRGRLGTGESEYSFTGVGASAALVANDGAYRPLHAAVLFFRVSVRRTLLGGPFDLVVDWATVIGEPLASTVLSLNPNATDAWQAKEFTITPPVGAARFRLRIQPAGIGTYFVSAPFLTPLGVDSTAAVNTLSARLTSEELARVTADTALASRSSVLEAAARGATNNESANLIANGLLTTDEANWLLIGDARRYALFPFVGGVVPTQFGIGFTGTGGTAVANPNIAPLTSFVDFYRPVTTRTLRLQGYFFRFGDVVDTTFEAQVLFANADLTNTQMEQFPFPDLVRGQWHFFDHIITVPAQFSKVRVQFACTMTGTVCFVAAPRLLALDADPRIATNELTARITTEEQARVAGDTALATRSTTLEAESRFIRESGGNLIDNALLTDNADRWTPGGWIRRTGIANLPTPAVWDGVPGALALQANLGERRPLPARSLEVKFSVQRIGTMASALVVGVDFFRADQSFISSVTMALTNANTSSTWSLVAFIATAPPEAARWRLTFTKFEAADHVAIAAPFVSANLADLTALDARITTEQTARVAGDTALAQQIQTIIAEGIEGAQTFRQPAPPANPEIGWLWYNTADANKPYRWSGTVWESIQDGGVNVNTARIDSEQTARINADTALATDITTVNARVTTEASRTNALVSTEATTRASADDAAAIRIAQTEASTAANATRITNETSARTTADTALGTRIDTLGATVTSKDTATNARITAEAGARADADAALASQTTALSSTVTTKDTATNARITAEANTRAAADTALATRATNTETSVGGLTARVTTNEESIDGIKAKYAVSVDANGNVVGFELIAGGGISTFDILADRLLVTSPSAPAAAGLPLFEVTGQGVRIRNAFIGQLSTDQLRIDDLVLDTNASGELTIRKQGVTADLLAQNAAVRPYSFFGQGTWIVSPRNAWVNAQIGGQVALLPTNNPLNSTGFLEIVVVFAASNAGNDDDTMAFRIQRSDGITLPQVYSNVNIFETFGRNAMTTLHFFDERVPALTSLNYTLQVQSNDATPVRGITMLGKMFKNASASPTAAW